MKLAGIALASLLTRVFEWVAIVGGTTRIESISDAIFCPTKEAFSDWGAYIKVCIPAYILLCCDTYAGVLLFIFSGILGVTQLSAYTILYNIGMMTGMIPFGMQTAMITIIGNSIGKGNVSLARRSLKTISALVALIAFVLSGSIYLLRVQVSELYTDVVEVQLMVQQVLLPFSIASFFAMIAFFLQAPLRALNLQGKGAIVSVISYWLFSLPLAAFLAFSKDKDLSGLNSGNAVGMFVSMALLAILISRVDFEKKVAEAKKRSEDAKKKAEQAKAEQATAE